MEKKKRFTIILGNIDFYEKLADGENKAVINKLDGVLNVVCTKEEAETLAEDIIEKRFYDSYLILPMYRYPVEYKRTRITKRDIYLYVGYSPYRL
jgi:hypothetical protein